MGCLIQIVEDEPDLVDTLTYTLQQNGYDTRAAYSGEEAYTQLEQQPLPDLVLLDLMLPDADGVEICARLRQNPITQGIPVLMLTARSEEPDRVGGLEAGADDYVVKPFSVRELVLRIQAILRRQVFQPEDGRRIRCGLLDVDLDTQEVQVDLRPITLSTLEFRLLAFFLKHRDTVLSRELLLEKVWGINSDIQTRTVDVHVMRLREKLGVAGEYIATVRGFGYRFVGE